jgi:hypothetical protein
MPTLTQNHSTQFAEYAMNKPNQMIDNTPGPAEVIATSNWGLIDIRLLRVILKFSYMFYRTQCPVHMADQWITPFAATCAEIDQLLGDDKRGFHWQQLGSQGSRVDWYWGLGEDHSSSLLMRQRGSHIDFEIANSPHDPQNEVREAIRAIVLRGEANARKQSKVTGKGGDAA